MRKVSVLVAILAIFASVSLFARPDIISAKFQLPNADTKELLYRDIFMTLLMPKIDDAIDNFYGKYLNVLPREDPWAIKILDIERPNGDRTSLFIIKLQVLPYLGPHNSIGRDNITIRVRYGSEPETLKFEHLESYPIPIHYKNVIKTKWPPE